MNSWSDVIFKMQKRSIFHFLSIYLFIILQETEKHCDALRLTSWILLLRIKKKDGKRKQIGWKNYFKFQREITVKLLIILCQLQLLINKFFIRTQNYLIFSTKSCSLKTLNSFTTAEVTSLKYKCHHLKMFFGIIYTVFFRTKYLKNICLYIKLTIHACFCAMEHHYYILTYVM